MFRQAWKNSSNEDSNHPWVRVDCWKKWPLVSPKEDNSRQVEYVVSITSSPVSIWSIITHAFGEDWSLFNGRQHVIARGKHNNISKHFVNCLFFLFNIINSIFTRRERQRHVYVKQNINCSVSLSRPILWTDINNMVKKLLLNLLL